MEARHEAADIPRAERIAYLEAVGAMAVADGTVSDTERSRITELGRALGLQDTTVDRFLARLADDAVDTTPELAKLVGSELRFTLLLDCLIVAYADDQVVVEEETALAALAVELDIDDAQVAALHKLAEGVAKPKPIDEAQGEVISKALSDSGIPARPIALVSAAGAGITTSAVAFGALAGLLGLSTGVGALLGLGIGSVACFRWLDRKLFSEAP